MKSKFKRLVVSSLIVIFGLILLGQIDDPLSEESQTLLNRIPDNPESQAYLYLLGIGSAESTRPEAAGKVMLLEYHKEINEDIYSETTYLEEKLPLPESEFSCHSSQAECIVSIFELAEQYPILAEENETLINRFNRFLNFDGYSSVTQPNMVEPLPDYRYLVLGHKLAISKAIHAFKFEDEGIGLNQMLHLQEAVRNAFQYQDTLIGKMVFVAMISENLDVMSVILTKNKIPFEPLIEFSKLELDFSMPASREFATVYREFNLLDRRTEFFKVGGYVPGWVVRLFYKPNMSINALTPYYVRMIKLASILPADYPKLMNQMLSNPKTSKIRNREGFTLVQYAVPNYEKFVSRVKDLEVKIKLFNDLYSDKSKKFINPYFPDESFQEYQNRICFNGFSEENQKYQCLITSLK